MPQVRFSSPPRSVEVPVGTTLLEAARLAGIDIESPCNGAGVCEKCKIRLLNGADNVALPNGACRLTDHESRAGWVLACHAVITGDIHAETQAVQESGHSILIEGRLRNSPFHPWIQKRCDSLNMTTSVLAGNDLLRIEEGDTSHETYGLAIDIGTTTLAVSLVDLTDGRELGGLSSLNPQTVFGHDVLSRIQFASERSGLIQLQKRLIDELNRMIAELADEFEVSLERIYEAVLSGNTTMLHLAAGANPHSLGRYPYTPVIRGGQSFSASEIGLQIATKGVVYFPPIFDAYVGADIASGVWVTDLEQNSGTTLFIDIGTNGEMILAIDGQLYATSTAAGPAFEGMNISCGMRAAEGAIESFEISPEGRIRIQTIGNTPPSGICGSGLVDLVGELAAWGVIDKSGRLARKNGAFQFTPLEEHLILHEGKPAFQLGGHVFLTQKDIRQVQLAKGAIRAGIDALLRQNNQTPETVDRVWIAGSFGYHLRPESLINLGLVPESFEDKIEFVGNTSKTGAQAFLLDQSARRRIVQIVEETHTVDLAHSPNFEKLFVQSLAFPQKRGRVQEKIQVTANT
jgi:uncharacterized 2Fe-2S/4Fe-4S cluster protein (DUF4445 family)